MEFKSGKWLIALAVSGCSGSATVGSLEDPGARSDAELEIRSESSRSLVANPSVDVAAALKAARLAYHVEGNRVVARVGAYAAERADATGLSLSPLGGAGADGRARAETSPLRLSPTRVASGARTLLDDGAHARVSSDGKVSLETGSVVESLENTDAGVEQSWTFRERPVGTSEIEVSMQVAGERFTTSDARGLHFVDDETGLGFVYGVATWIDAAGVRTTVSPRFENGRIVLRVPADLAARSSFPAVLDPLIGPEAGVGTPLVGAAGVQTAPDIAFDPASGTYLVVWQDARTSTSQIWGTLIDRARGLLTPAGFPIPTKTSKSQTSPRVTRGNTGFWVVWQEGPSSTTDAEIRARPVGPTGQLGSVVDVDGTTDASAGALPAIAYNAPNVTVSWTTNAGEVKATTLGPSGSIVAKGISLGTGARMPILFRPTASSIASDGANLLVTWSDGTNILYRHLAGATGALLGSEPLAFSMKPYLTDSVDSPSVTVANDGLYFWLIAHAYSAGADALAIIPVPHEGAYDFGGVYSVNGSQGYLLATWIAGYSSASRYNRPTLTSMGSDYLLAATGIPLVQLTLTRASTSWLQTSLWQRSTTASPSPSGTVRVATDGYAATTAFDGCGTASNDVCSDARSLTGAPASGFKGVVSNDHGNGPANLGSATDGTNHLLVWTDVSNGVSSIYGTIVRADGTIATPGGRLLATGPLAGNRSMPTVAYGSYGGSSYYMVAWRNDTTQQIEYTRVDPTTGAPLEGVVSLYAGAADVGLNPRLAWSGKDFVLTWKSAAGMAASSLFARRITATGVVYAPKLLTQEPSNAHDVACIPNAGCAAVFESYHPSWMWANGTAGLARLGVNDETPELATMKTGCNSGWVGPGALTPRIAASNSGFMAVCQSSIGEWNATYNKPAWYYYVYAEALDANGDAIGTGYFGIPTASWQSDYQLAYDWAFHPMPKVAFDGTEFVVVFDKRASTACAATAASHDRYVQHVSTAGAMIGGATLVQAGVTPDWEGSRITGASAGRKVLVPYLKDASNACGVPTPYVFARFQSP
jgi:hypothetical protein